jgi:hypothetical protein
MILVKASPILSRSLLFTDSFRSATTQGGALRLKIERVDDPTTNHNLQYRSAMVCIIMRSAAGFTYVLRTQLQSWYDCGQMFCMTRTETPIGTSSASQAV